MMTSNDQPDPENEDLDETDETPDPETKAEKTEDEADGDPPSEVRHFKPAKPGKS